MELNEAVIRTGHPPHSGTHKKNRHPLSRILPKIAIFVLIFLLSFHLPNFIPGLDQREQTIREILEVLEKSTNGFGQCDKRGTCRGYL